MSRIRIACRGVEELASGDGVRSFAMPTLGDVEVRLVDDEGKEHPIHGITRVSWEASCTDTVPIARIDVAGVEVDVEGVPVTEVGVRVSQEELDALRECAEALDKVLRDEDEMRSAKTALDDLERVRSDR